MLPLTPATAAVGMPTWLWPLSGSPAPETSYSHVTEDERGDGAAEVRRFVEEPRPTLPQGCFGRATAAGVPAC